MAPAPGPHGDGLSWDAPVHGDFSLWGRNLSKCSWSVRLQDKVWIYQWHIEISQFRLFPDRGLTAGDTGGPRLTGTGAGRREWIESSLGARSLVLPSPGEDLRAESWSSVHEAGAVPTVGIG